LGKRAQAGKNFLYRLQAGKMPGGFILTGADFIFRIVKKNFYAGKDFDQLLFDGVDFLFQYAGKTAYRVTASFVRLGGNQFHHRLALSQIKFAVHKSAKGKFTGEGVPEPACA